MHFSVPVLKLFEVWRQMLPDFGSQDERFPTSVSVLNSRVTTDFFLLYRVMNSPKCVMIDARYIQSQTSGIGRYTENLVRNLLEIDPNLRLRLVTHPSKPNPIESERVHCQPYAAAPNSLRTRFAMTKQLEFGDAELFHSPFNILPKELPIPAVFTLHDIMWLIDANYCTDSQWRRLVTGSFYKKFIPASVEEAKRILTVSHHSKQEIEDFFPHRRGEVSVTYNGVDPFFQPVPEDEAKRTLKGLIPIDKPFVLVVGQGSPYKNHAGALGGFIDAFVQQPDVNFVIVRRFQRGPAHEYEKLTSHPTMKGRLFHLQHVSGEALKALYSAASVFLFPSLYEGFGLPALEAMACGTAVVTSEFGAPAEVCGDGALKVDPRDNKAIGDALRLLLNDQKKRDEICAAGRKRAATFTWRQCAEQALATYSEALRD